ncbi:hypothetical protein ACFQYP_63915 [Nonomuraea antimicrobica]
MLELSLRHRLTPAEVGAVLGLTSRQAAARLGRARDHLENAAAAVVLARTGRAHCPDLSAMVDSWEGPLTPLLRRRLSGHISGCEVCTEGRHRQVSAGRLLDLVAVAYPGISLRRRVIDTCVNPELDQTRVLITDRGDSFDRSGFPVAVERRSRRRRPRRLTPLVLAVACLLTATGAMVVFNGRDASNTTTLRPVASPTPPAEEESAAPEPVTEEDETDAVDETGETDEPTTSPSPSRTPSATTTPSARPRASRPRTRPATGRSTAPKPTRSSAAPGARFSVSCPQSVDGLGKIGLRARNAAVSWVATASQGLDVYPASGSVKAGASSFVWVTVVDPSGSGSGRVSFTSNGGTASCSLTWHAESPSGNPTEEPRPTEEPAATPTSGVATSSAHGTETDPLS